MQPYQPNLFQKILKSEMTPGIFLISAAIFAMILANSPLATKYFGFIEATKPINVLFIINDLLMAIFFLDVGLEIKHQIVIGHLSKPTQIALPILAAIGGVITPALIFLIINFGNLAALKGWAVPTATDIAFAVGIISLLRKHLPLELKVLLMAIAVIDDLIAILIIALFYTQNISLFYGILLLATIFILYLMNKKHFHSISAYLVVGAFLWFCMLKTGIHPTLSGVITALFIPLNSRQVIHKKLSFLVTYIILPLFAFANSGIALEHLSIKDINQPISLGIALGLILGKQFGVFSFCYFSIKAKIATLPPAISWKLLYGMAMLCGIGFTMSIFIGHLAYDDMATSYILHTKLGVLLGSTFSAITGYVFLRYVTRRKKPIIENQ